MKISTLIVGGHRYRLAVSTDLASLAEELEEAIGAGGRLVTVPVTGDTTVLVLVSAAIPLALESIEVSDADGQDTDSDDAHDLGDDIF